MLYESLVIISANSYQTCKDKKQDAKDALEKNLEMIEETRKAIVDIDDLVDALQESLSVISEQRKHDFLQVAQTPYALCFRYNYSHC
jgi:methylthioribose-1-phosphate isomerase